MTILKFSLLSACKSNHRVVRSRYWGLVYYELWFSFAFFLRFRQSWKMFVLLTFENFKIKIYIILNQKFTSK